MRKHLGLLLCTAASLIAQSPLAVTGLGAGVPLSIQASATPVRLVIDLALKPEWHVYSRDVGGGQPVVVRLASDCAYAAAGELRFPPDEQGKLSGKVRLELPIAAVAATGAGARLQAEMEFMVCDPLMCLPPMSVTIAGDVRADRVLLVVDETDERSARIVAFLQERGFAADVTTYDAVTLEACDGHDLVLADSKLFGEGKKVRQQVRAFPRTSTPIVAVGFYGTELIEGHGIAMTSGYI